VARFSVIQPGQTDLRIRPAAVDEAIVRRLYLPIVLNKKKSMTLRKTFSQRLQIFFLSLFIIIMKLRFRRKELVL